MASNYVRLKLGNYVAIVTRVGEKKLIEVMAHNKEEALEKAKGYSEDGEAIVCPVPAMIGVLM